MIKPLDEKLWNVAHFYPEQPQTEVLTFVPGNSTQYTFIVTRFPHGANLGEIGWINNPCAFIFVSNAKKGYLFEDNPYMVKAYLYSSYVKEKLNVDGDDLTQITKGLATILNRTAM